MPRLLLVVVTTVVVVSVWGWGVHSCPSAPAKSKPPKKPQKRPAVNPREPQKRVYNITNGTKQVQLDIPRGGNATVNCTKPKGLEIDDLRWTKNEVPLTNSGRYLGGSLASPNLTIKPLMERDKGNYTCQFFVDNVWHSSSTLYILDIVHCVDKMYGYFCNKECGFCKDNAACHHKLGKCERGCMKGYEPPFCKDRNNCTLGTYYPNCEPCGLCKSNALNETINCNISTGQCEKCQKGYDLPYCKKEDEGSGDSNAQSLAIGVGVGAPATLGFAAAMLQLVKCMASGLPSVPTCGGGDSDDEENEDEQQALFPFMGPTPEGQLPLGVEPPPGILVVPPPPIPGEPPLGEGAVFQVQPPQNGESSPSVFSIEDESSHASVDSASN